MVASAGLADPMHAGDPAEAQREKHASENHMEIAERDSWLAAAMATRSALPRIARGTTARNMMMRVADPADAR